MTTNIYTIEGKGSFALPADKLLTVFESQRNAAILVKDKNGVFSGHSVADSIHLRAHRTPESRREAIADLLTRNGATYTPAVI